MKIQRITVKKNERGLLFRNGDFDRMLWPGKHWVFDGIDTLSVETFALDRPAFVHPLADYFMAKEPALVAEAFVRVDLSTTQVGLRTENGVLVEVLAPGTRGLYWKGQVDVQVEVIDIADSAEVPAAVNARLLQTPARVGKVEGLAGVHQVQVPEHGAGILWIDGVIDRLLTPGNYAFWKFNRDIAVAVLEMRYQMMEITGQEILTRDKVTLRLNLSATWRFADVLKTFRHLAKPADVLYRELQFGLRSAVATRTLDELLENKAVIDDVVLAHVRSRLGPHGIEVDTVGVKDLVLPGEMRAILAQVVEAEKAAEANAIRRREETAATRSLLNTAKVMEGNPIALRMKELEALERISERVDKISVFGGLDQVLNGLVTLRSE